MKIQSHTYTVGRSEGVVYPRGFPCAPSVPQMAELYDKAAQRIKQLEAALREISPDHEALKP